MEGFVNRVIAIAMLSLLLAGCNSTSVNRSDTSSFSGDGLTTKTAVKVSSIGEEKAWVDRNYPGATIESQSLLMRPSPMDLIEIQLPTGETRRIYFDISSFFGEM